MRQVVGEKKVKRYREKTELPICTALVRGDSNHRVDLLLDDGRVMEYYPRTGDLEENQEITWNQERWDANKRKEG